MLHALNYSRLAGFFQNIDEAFDAQQGWPQILANAVEQELQFLARQGIGAREHKTLNAFGRKSSGSYYTPDELVQLIIERTIGPLVGEAETAFSTLAKQKAKPDELTKLDPAEAILRLKICDPAMGSGHFLVTLVDWMTCLLYTSPSPRD